MALSSMEKSGRTSERGDMWLSVISAVRGWGRTVHSTGVSEACGQVKDSGPVVLVLLHNAFEEVERETE